MNIALFKLPIIIFFFFCAVFGHRNLVSINNEQIKNNEESEVLYLPSARGIGLMSLGYKNAVSDFIWFKTVNYFGKHYRSDRKYKWLSSMCSLILDLDPYKKHVYEFCSLILSSEAGLPLESSKILTKGINFDPGYWRYYYLRAMNSLMYLKDEEAAKKDFVLGAKQDGAPEFMARIAIKKNVDLENPYLLVGLLEGMIRDAKDKTQKGLLFEQLKKVKHELNLVNLNKQLKSYLENTNKVPDNINELLANPKQVVDPFGGNYYIDKKNLKIRSTSKVNKLNFYKKKDDN